VSGSASHKKSDDPFRGVSPELGITLTGSTTFFTIVPKGGFEDFFAGQSGPNVNEYYPAFLGTDSD
jgi:hypothetical protein